MNTLDFCLKYPFVVSYFENKFGERKYFDDIDSDIIQEQLKDLKFPVINLINGFDVDLVEFKEYRKDLEKFISDGNTQEG